MDRRWDFLKGWFATVDALTSWDEGYLDITLGWKRGVPDIQQ